MTAQASLQGYLYAGSFEDATNLDRWIGGLKGIRWAYLESEVAVQLVGWPVVQPGNYPVGRAFGPDYEVRWQQAAGSIAVQVLTENSPLPGDFTSNVLQLKQTFHTVGTQVHLWGERDGRQGIETPVWIETRIPHPLRYPFGPTERIEISARHYCCNNIIVLTRWRDVVHPKAENP